MKEKQKYTPKEVAEMFNTGLVAYCSLIEVKPIHHGHITQQRIFLRDFAKYEEQVPNNVRGNISVDKVMMDERKKINQYLEAVEKSQGRKSP